MISAPSPAELLAMLVKAGRDTPASQDDVYFIGEVMAVSGAQVSVRPDSSADGTWIGPISTLGNTPPIGAKVLCARIGTFSICLGPLDAGGGKQGTRVQTTGNLTIGPTTWTVLGPYGNILYNTAGMTATASRLTCTTSGLYVVSAGGTFGAIANSTVVNSGGGGGGGTINISSIGMSFITSTTYSFGTVFWGDGDWILGPINFTPGGSGFFSIPGASAYIDTDIDLSQNDRAIRLLLNGTTVIAESGHPVVGNHQARMAVSTDIFLNVGDYVQCQVWHSNVSNLTLLSGSHLAAHT